MTGKSAPKYPLLHARRASAREIGERLQLVAASPIARLDAAVINRLFSPRALAVYVKYLGDPDGREFDVSEIVDLFYIDYRGSYGNLYEACKSAVTDVAVWYLGSSPARLSAATPNEIAKFRREAATSYDILRAAGTYYLYRKVTGSTPPAK
ncbi:MAG: hypothetical protein FWD74_00680 [Actinomycetia bacterium]|nr:hypothetical protein [Actinomycetes bacterium]